MTTRTDNHSEEQAKAQLESIKEMVAALLAAQERENETGSPEAEEARDEARQAIEEDPLSVEVRYGWITPGREADMVKDGPDEFCILLCTGGPACRIVGDLDEHRQPIRPRLQHQDWGTPWIELIVTGEDREALETYCQQFYFGE